MPARTRSRSTLVSGTFKPNNGGLATSSDVLNMSEVTEDVTGMGDCTYFDRQLYQGTPCLVNGNSHPGSSLTGGLYTNYPVAPSGFWTSAGDVNSQIQTEGTYGSQILARTNPGRSSIDSIVSGIELREIPSMLKNTFAERLERLFKFIPNRRFQRLGKVARFHLMVQFGIIPVVSDCIKMASLHNAIKQRSKELDRMESRGLRRTVTLDLVSRQDFLVDSPIWSTSGRVYSVDATKNTVCQIRGHVRWFAQNALRGLSDEAKNKLIYKAVAGLNVSPQTVYELMPWSWLVDYFTNLGTIVKAANNSIPCSHSQPVVMKHYTWQATVTKDRHSLNWGTLKVSPPSFSGDRKYRRVVATSLSARIGLLTASQSSIIGSLAASYL